MKIIEMFIKGKKDNQALCEDALFIGEDFIGVIDGVTSKGSCLFGGLSGGKAAAEALKAAVEDLPRDIDAISAAELFTEKIATLYPGEPDGSAAAGIILFSKAKSEIWSIGDCQCIINGDFHSHEKEVDRILSDMRDLVLAAEIKNGKTLNELRESDCGRDFIMPFLKVQHIFANGEGRYSYGVLNGTAVHQDKIIVYKVNSGDEIVLASDGYPKLFTSLGESEEYLKKELKENPLCIGSYRSTKGLQAGNSSFDDRTYIRFKV